MKGCRVCLNKTKQNTPPLLPVLYAAAFSITERHCAKKHLHPHLLVFACYQLTDSKVRSLYRNLFFFCFPLESFALNPPSRLYFQGPYPSFAFLAILSCLLMGRSN